MISPPSFLYGYFWSFLQCAPLEKILNVRDTFRDVLSSVLDNFRRTNSPDEFFTLFSLDMLAQPISNQYSQFISVSELNGAVSGSILNVGVQFSLTFFRYV